MKKVLFPALIAALGLSYSCESFQSEEQQVLLPVNMTATIVQGTETRKVIADYHYIDGTDRLDHITWSNHQTHNFEYDDSDRIRVVRQMNVDTKVQEERWFQYDGSLVDCVILVKRNLDYIYLEPVDSAYAGHIEFVYDGEHIIKETRYEVMDGISEKAVRNVEYEYDMNGNILSSRSTDLRSSSGESLRMTYDNNKHPLSALQYYFTGESFINNQLSKSLESKGVDYSYELKLNEYGYPEMIYEKRGMTNSRIIRYSYMSL